MNLNQMNLNQPWIKQFFALSTTYGTALTLLVVPIASFAQSPELSEPPLRFVSPTLSQQTLTQLADRGAPRRRSGAGTRGDCPPLAAGTPEPIALVALVPSPGPKQNEAIALGLTTEAHPTFWVYIPYDRTEISRLQFVLLDEQEEPVIAPITISVQTTPGVVSLQLPETAPPLTMGKYYRWYVTIDCQPQGSTDTYVEGMIQRVELPANLRQQLLKATAKERTQLYAENGIWYDALTQMQMLRQQSPDDPKLKAAWVSLLESVGLGAVVKR